MRLEFIGREANTSRCNEGTEIERKVKHSTIMPRH